MKRKFIAFLHACLLALFLVGCKGNTSADLVVYGKIYTSEDNKVVEAFAVKDGKIDQGTLILRSDRIYQ
jgi:hypothetical protein